MRAPLKPLDDALAELLAQALPLAGDDTVDSFDADGRVLLADAVSPLQVPPQDNSAMPAPAPALPFQAGGSGSRLFHQRRILRAAPVLAARVHEEVEGQQA
jgi:hypothetical protein